MPRRSAILTLPSFSRASDKAQGKADGPGTDILLAPEGTMPSSLPTPSHLAPLAEGTHPTAPTPLLWLRPKALRYPREGHGD